MRTVMLTDIWVCSPLAANDHGEVLNHYINLRREQANIQADYSEIDIQTFGQYINEVIKLRFISRPDISVGDMIYLHEPSIKVTFEHGGETYDDFGDGDYKVQQVNPAFIGPHTFRNPTTVVARMVTGDNHVYC